MAKTPSSMKLRQNANQTQRKENRKEKKPAKQPPVTKAENSWSSLIYPAGDTTFKALLSARFCAGIWSHISDCDETYNYWEPMHYLVFGKGLQTWEYSPEYALRSYTYLMVHAIPAYIYERIFKPNPILMFYFIRCLLGLICAFSEVYFYKSVCKEFGVHIARICLCFQLFSSGMFISSTAFLPSSFAMYTFAASCAAWWDQRHALAIFFTALGSLLGWPFAAWLGIPLAFDMVFRKKKYLDFVAWSAISFVVIAIPMIIIDSIQYGKLVIAPLNIVLYNVLSGHGPNLYGTEPFSFYLINGFLNFNFVWILALICPVAIVCNYLFVPSRNKCTLYLPHWLSLSPMFLWLLIFMIQPHKEERFLFPIYPMICLSGAVSLDILQKLCFRIWSIFKKMPPGTHYLDKTMHLSIAVLCVTSLISISRVLALYKNYHAPMNLMLDINRYPLDNEYPETMSFNVCLGKEWHRYPGSFFLPYKTWDIRFIKSEFSGLLPSPYSHEKNATSIIPPHFNDRNEENPSVYFDIKKCHFLLDTDFDKETELEPNYSNKTDSWKILKSYRFLNAEKSNPFFRAFYVPFLSEKYCSFGKFNLLQAAKLKLKHVT